MCIIHDCTYERRVSEEIKPVLITDHIINSEKGGWGLCDK